MSPIYCFGKGHNSTIYFIDDVGPSACAQTVAFSGLPLRDVGQLSLFFRFTLLLGNVFSKTT
jgi:hypothetical protein